MLSSNTGRYYKLFVLFVLFNMYPNICNFLGGDGFCLNKLLINDARGASLTEDHFGVVVAVVVAVVVRDAKKTRWGAQAKKREFEKKKKRERNLHKSSCIIRACFQMII